MNAAVRALAATWLALLAVPPALATARPAPVEGVCDVDRDGDIDRNNIGAILAGLGRAWAGLGGLGRRASTPDDPRDFNRDGYIRVNDAVACTLCCSRPFCAPVTANRRPVASAGPDQSGVTIGSTVTLDGSTAALEDPSAVRPTFVADRFGTYEFELVVSAGRPCSTTCRTASALNSSEYFLAPIAPSDIAIMYDPRVSTKTGPIH